MTKNNEVFTASNGIQVRVSPDAVKRVQYKSAASVAWGNVGKYSGGYSADSAVGVALAEFYRHREDVRLRRVRSEVDTDYVIYVDNALPEDPSVRVWDEKTGRSAVYYLSDTTEDDSTWDTHRNVARAYFEANPPAPVLPTEPGLYVNSTAWSKTRTNLVILALGVGGDWTRKDNGDESSSAEALEFATYWAKNGELVRLSAEV